MLCRSRTTFLKFHYNHLGSRMTIWGQFKEDPKIMFLLTEKETESFSVLCYYYYILSLLISVLSETLFVCLVGLFRPTRKMFTHMETSLLPVKNCKFWPMVDRHSYATEHLVMVSLHHRSPSYCRTIASSSLYPPTISHHRIIVIEPSTKTPSRDSELYLGLSGFHTEVNIFSDMILRAISREPARLRRALHSDVYLSSQSPYIGKVEIIPDKLSSPVGIQVSIGPLQSLLVVKGALQSLLVVKDD